MKFIEINTGKEKRMTIFSFHFFLYNKQIKYYLIIYIILKKLLNEAVDFELASEKVQEKVLITLVYKYYYKDYFTTPHPSLKSIGKLEQNDT